MLEQAGDFIQFVARARPGGGGGTGQAANGTSPFVPVPNSIDNLGMRDPFVQAAAQLKIDQGVAHHSIIGRVDATLSLQQSSDGIVPYASSHLETAASEVVMSSGHSVQEHPAAMIELRRILHLHLSSLASRASN